MPPQFHIAQFFLLACTFGLSITTEVVCILPACFCTNVCLRAHPRLSHFTCFPLHRYILQSAREQGYVNSGRLQLAQVVGSAGQNNSTADASGSGNSTVDLFNVPFDRMLHVSRCKESDLHLNKDHFNVSALADDGSFLELNVASEKAQLIHKAISECCNGVRFRSKYCVAFEQRVEEEKGLGVEVGDLLMLESIYANSEAAIMYGVNERTKLKGEIYSNSVCVIPSITRPSDALVDLYVSAARQGLLYAPEDEPITTAEQEELDMKAMMGM